MKIFCGISSGIFLIAAIVALWMRDPVFSIACCAMSGLCRLDAEIETLKHGGKK